jgi:hypothetical protein
VPAAAAREQVGRLTTSNPMTGGASARSGGGLSLDRVGGVAPSSPIAGASEDGGRLPPLLVCAGSTAGREAPVQGGALRCAGSSAPGGTEGVRAGCRRKQGGYACSHCRDFGITAL